MRVKGVQLWQDEKANKAMGLAIDNKLNEHPVLHAFMCVLLSFLGLGAIWGGTIGATHEFNGHVLNGFRTCTL